MWTYEVFLTYVPKAQTQKKTHTDGFKRISMKGLCSTGATKDEASEKQQSGKRLVTKGCTSARSLHLAIQDPQATNKKSRKWDQKRFRNVNGKFRKRGEKMVKSTPNLPVMGDTKMKSAMGFHILLNGLGRPECSHKH